MWCEEIPLFCASFALHHNTWYLMRKCPKRPDQAGELQAGKLLTHTHFKAQTHWNDLCPCFSGRFKYFWLAFEDKWLQYDLNIYSLCTACQPALFWVFFFVSLLKYSVDIRAVCITALVGTGRLYRTVQYLVLHRWAENIKSSQKHNWAERQGGGDQY